MSRAYVVEPPGQQIPLDPMADFLPASSEQGSKQRTFISGS
jgi:hypothetical protein